MPNAAITKLRESPVKSMQRGIATIPAGSTVVNVAISPVVIGKCQVRVTGTEGTGNTFSGARMPWATFQSTSSLQIFMRGNNTDNFAYIRYVSYEILELK